MFKNFNDFFAVFYCIFFLVWLFFLLIMLINIPLSTIESMGLGVITGVLVGPIVLIAKYYYRKAPPRDDPPNKDKQAAPK